MKKTSRIIVFVLIVSLTMLGGCQGNNRQTDNNLHATKQVEMIVFTDSVGREVELPKDISRVLPSGSLAQIFLYAVAPDSLIGISGGFSEDASKYVENKYLNLPEIGGFYGKDNLNLEEVAALNPEVIIDIGETKMSIAEDMDTLTKQTGIPTIHIAAGIDTMGSAFRILGELLGEKEQGDKLGEYCDTLYQDMEKISSEAMQGAGKPKLLYLTSENGESVVAKGSYHAEIIDMLGDNLAIVDNPSGKGTGNEVDMEQILEWNPEIIIFAPDGYYDHVKDDSIWQQLDAVRNGKFFKVPNGPYNWLGFPPSSNRVLGMGWLAAVLYPDKMETKIKGLVEEYYQLFYHYELTSDEYADLVKDSISSIDNVEKSTTSVE